MEGGTSAAGTFSSFLYRCIQIFSMSSQLFTWLWQKRQWGVRPVGGCVVWVCGGDGGGVVRWGGHPCSIGYEIFKMPRYSSTCGPTTKSPMAPCMTLWCFGRPMLRPGPAQVRQPAATAVLCSRNMDRTCSQTRTRAAPPQQTPP